jgi:hypothetical protein
VNPRLNVAIRAIRGYRYTMVRSGYGTGGLLPAFRPPPSPASSQGT